MELRQLKTFQTVGKLLSFNRAAETLNYAQSTVSVQIRLLEAEFGVPLFDRLGKRVILTEAGQALMRYAQKMIDIEEETLSEVTGRTQPQGSLSIRIPQSLGTCYLPAILSKFRTRYPKVGFDINSCAYHSLEQELKSGVTDLAFLLAESINARDLKFEVLGIVPLVIVAQAGHPLAGRRSVGVRDLQGEAIIFPKHDCSYRMVFEQILIEEKVKTAAVIEMNSVEAIKQCVMKGVGLTIMPEISIKKEITAKELVVLPWGDEVLETGILMIRHKDKWISPTLQAFMETVREEVTG
ncbi:MAG: LysR family transcriptional regulator [Deltaproteobacteria bacterium]|nr:LysR family transcriptional regulator [Deltaproteobacteria bacterium]MBF0527255.1 LysR family transcriptional regulator [Deltaproteobacteria bacterium]